MNTKILVGAAALLTVALTATSLSASAVGFEACTHGSCTYTDDHSQVRNCKTSQSGTIVQVGVWNNVDNHCDNGDSGAAAQ